MALHPDVQALSRALHELEAILREQGVPHWADKVARCAQSVDQSDAYGLTRFLSLFGGMGSLNDLVLQRGGVALTHENDELDRLRERAWNLANSLQHERSL